MAEGDLTATSVSSLITRVDSAWIELILANHRYVISLFHFGCRCTFPCTVITSDNKNSLLSVKYFCLHYMITANVWWPRLRGWFINIGMFILPNIGTNIGPKKLHISRAPVLKNCAANPVAQIWRDFSHVFKSHTVTRIWSCGANRRRILSFTCSRTGFSPLIFQLRDFPSSCVGQLTLPSQQLPVAPPNILAKAFSIITTEAMDRISRVLQNDLHPTTGVIRAACICSSARYKK